MNRIATASLHTKGSMLTNSLCPPRSQIENVMVVRRTEIVFSMNAIAIIPLAGLLGKGTETVAASFGDAVGALMNVTFGNAVELIIL